MGVELQLEPFEPQVITTLQGYDKRLNLLTPHDPISALEFSRDALLRLVHADYFTGMAIGFDKGKPAESRNRLREVFPDGSRRRIFAFGGMINSELLNRDGEANVSNRIMFTRNFPGDKALENDPWLLPYSTSYMISEEGSDYRMFRAWVEFDPYGREHRLSFSHDLYGIFSGTMKPEYSILFTVDGTRVIK